MHRLPYELCQQVYNITGDKWTAAQLPVLMDDTERFPFIIGGERGGKSYTGKGIAVPHIALLPTVKPNRFYDDTGKLLFNPKDNSSKPRNPDFSLFGPSYAEPRVEFEYIEKDLRKLGEIPANWRHVSKPSDGPWRLTTKSGVVITTWSMDDPGTIRAVDLEMALICEAGRCPYDGIERVQGRVSAQRGPIIYSGCLRGDTLVQTSEGLLSLEELKGTPVGYAVRGKKGRGQVVQWHDNGVQPTKIVSFNYGMEIEGTLNHKLLVRGPGLGGAQWRRLDELRLGDKVWASLDVDIWGQNHMDPDDAYLAGLYLGDGSSELYKRGGGRITITVGKEEGETQSFLAGRGYRLAADGLHWRSGTDIKTVFSAGIPGEWKADDKEIPSFIRCADKETVRHFLAGLFDADGCAKLDGSVTLVSNSRRMLEQVQALMFNFGLVSGITNKDQGEYVGNTLTIQAGADFQERVGFRLTRKAERCIAGEKRQRLPSRQTDAGTRTGSQWGDCQFVTVKEIRNSECHTYDLSVPEGRSYTANGVISHNTLEESQQWYRDWAVMGQRPNKAGIKVYSLPTWSNHHEFPGGREDPEIIRLFNLYGEELFAQRCAGEPRPPRHRVLKEFQPRHVKMISLDDLVSEHPDVVFEICVDPGYAFAYALLIVARWTEFVPEEVNGELVIRKEQRFHFFDEFYEQGKVTSDIVDMLQAHTLWPELNKQRMGVFDIASKGHRDGGDSALDIWKKRLPRWNWNMKYWFEDRLIERLRTSARMDHFTISPKCAGLLAEAGLGEPVFDEMHPWKYMTDRNGQVTGEKPIDKWNHSTKAMGYYLLHHLGQVESYRKASSVSRLKSVKAKSRYGAPSTK